MITIDMAKARDIWRDRIKAAREPLFAPLDVAVLRTIEAAGDTRPLYAQKQALRDAPADPRIEAAQDLDALKAVWPDCLKG